MNFFHPCLPGLKGTLLWFILHIDPIWDELVFISHILVHLSRPFCETMLLGYKDLERYFNLMKPKLIYHDKNV